ncbi:RNA-binding protein Musashi homolog Rbp6-like isoform X2 [Eriocheir sinensis]|nr:RNA-binding protein Musashi homolog Rbp6-like isoform X2 [Eriocheir sinensis]XP_050717336.1 RNA-binding protein Musashi homolog Rbp6-like isoform X2 [Eriocheir sinensis]XP_050717337.1 RNA-binding protein Musashi homolog Rbp6-like isoform X2 [Eriocheir sinensis]
MEGVSTGDHMNGSSGASQGGSSGRSSPSDPAPNKMFVGGLSWQTTPEKLREYFGSYGTVRDVLIMKDPVTQRSRGFGFITFGDASSVEKVISVPNHMLDGKKIDPKHATPKNKGRTNRTKKIFVGGVSQETSAEEVKAYFSSFGKVEEAVMLMDNQTKRHRGFGFVTFECEDVVERVCDIHFHTIKNKKVECKKAQPKEAVQAASLLSKRLIVGQSGLANPIVTAQSAHIQAAAAAAAAAQAAALSGYGKLMGGGTYPPLSAYRYTPYPLPTSALTSGIPTAGGPHTTTLPSGATLSAVSAAPTIANQAAALSTSANHTIPTLSTHAGLTTPYQGYSLTNVDMSSFQGVDWNAMYGVGMYA